jgi:hypothetical protein
MSDLSEFKVYAVYGEDVILIHDPCGATAGQKFSVDGDNLPALIEMANTHECPKK